MRRYTHRRGDSSNRISYVFGRPLLKVRRSFEGHWPTGGHQKQKNKMRHTYRSQRSAQLRHLVKRFSSLRSQPLRQLDHWHPLPFDHMFHVRENSNPLPLQRRDRDEDRSWKILRSTKEWVQQQDDGDCGRRSTKYRLAMQRLSVMERHLESLRF